MRPQHRYFLSYVLLATYASISLLGDGLHSLLPAGDHHHHHHGLYVVSHSSGDAEHAGHSHDAAARTSSGYADLTASNCDADSHLCEICAFLYEAISQPAEVAAPIDWQPLVVVVHADPQPVYSLTSLGCPAARGPPLLLA
jgi:hypothetical protein